jgi:hypothetical protein
VKNIGWIDPVMLLKYLIPLEYFSHTVGSSPRVRTIDRSAASVADASSWCACRSNT